VFSEDGCENVAKFKELKFLEVSWEYLGCVLQG
jgi:hypothetical protein